MIRQLVAADFGEVRRHAEALAVNRYPEMLPDPGKMHELLSSGRLDSNHYSKVIGPEGAPEAALIARTGNNLWASRRHAAILLWYTTGPGLGLELLRDFRRWVGGQKSITVAGMVDDFGLDERTARLVQRVGFVKRGGLYAYFPRGKKT